MPQRAPLWVPATMQAGHEGRRPCDFQAHSKSAKSEPVKRKSADILKRYRVDAPDGFELKSVNCDDTGGIDKDAAHAMLAADVQRLADLQQRLYAEDRWAVLIVLQGMDAAGKDSIVAHVMSGVNPQGCAVHSFKAPSAEELDHDFLWRTTTRLPARGRIGIFNRSYYEDVLVVRVHPELLRHEKVPGKLIGKSIWGERFQDIRGFERHLARNGTLVLKFFLHVSKEEQRRRFLERLDEPAKRWKFSMDDISERRRWDDYMAAYQEMIRATSRPGAPWHVVPADHKWFTRLVVAAAVIEALEGLDLAFPKVEGAALKEMREVRAALLAEAPRQDR
jgi:PPK2 family polyphosphate:nucleotide phosphotransferase